MKKRRRRQKSKDKSLEHSKRGFSARPAVSRRRPTILIITLVSLCGLLLVGMIWIGKRRESSLSTSKNTPSFGEFGQRVVPTDLAPDNTSGLLPASTKQISPVNKVDPLTGKSITATSPTTTYKGYIVAFCCAKSLSYNGGWNRMSESEKDAFVLSCLKRQ
jgi:hypothetical protein